MIRMLTEEPVFFCKYTLDENKSKFIKFKTVDIVRAHRRQMNVPLSHLITGVFYRANAIGRERERESTQCFWPRCFCIMRYVCPESSGIFERISPPHHMNHGRTHIPTGRIFMGAKVKLVAYCVHLLIKYLLTKGNT